MKFSTHIDHNPDATGYEARWGWEVTDANGKTVDRGHTNSEGCGIWASHDWTNQIAGTCDFIAPSTKSGLRAKLIRERHHIWESNSQWADC